MPDRSWLADALAQYERPLVRYARHLTGDLEAARDIVQDCFLRLCQQPPAKVQGRVKPWLFLVCRNRAIDHLRKEGRMDALDKDLASAETPDGRAAERETKSEMRRCIDALPARQREVLRLKFQDGLSYRQIGEVVGITATNVGFLLHQALKTLRAQLAGRK